MHSTFAPSDVDVSTLIGDIYDAAVDRTRWPLVLESCRQFIGGTSAAIFAKNVTGDRVQLFAHDDRVDAQLTHAYFDHLAPLDPSNSVQVLQEVDDAVITSSFLDPEELIQSRFFGVWVQPTGLVDAIVAPIERRGSWAALFGVLLHENDGLGEEDARQRVSLLTPHVRRASAIAQIIGKARREADSFRDAIDGLAVGVFLVDAEGRLVHANAAGSTLLGTKKALTANHEGLLRLDRTSMRELLPRVDQDAPGSVVIETHAGDRYVAHVLPLASGARQFTGLGGDAVAALFVQPATFDPPSIPESLARAFDLTPGELRVALATIRHDGVSDVADTLGLSEATVRTHLHRIFAKTDTRRQADIVKLVAGFASPLAQRAA